jgi:FlaA1/EpsC-like NDP-sugar epimerase
MRSGVPGALSSRRIVGQVLVDILLVVASNAAAFALKYDPSGRDNPGNLETVTRLLPALVFLRLAVLCAFRLYRIHWRYLSIRDLWVIVTATTASSLGFYGVLLFTGHGGRGQYSWGMQAIDWVFNILLISGVRVGYRQLSENSLLAGGPPQAAATDERSTPSLPQDGRATTIQPPSPGSAMEQRQPPPRPRQRALIVGAGDAGETVARDLLRRPHAGVVPIGFVDDDPMKRRSRIHGLPVLGMTGDLTAVARARDVSVILLAIPNVRGQVIRDILAVCEQVPARLCIIPSVGEVLDGTARRAGGAMRDVRIEDLLRREPVHTDTEAIAGYISGERVLVTGAGGSIGAELCRQIAPLMPARLVLVGQGENSVFEIEQELVREFDFCATAVIADVKDRARLEVVFRQERPTVVFHTAAHKHVPLMEANPGEAVKNNVLGTRNVAELAAIYQAQRFIYVSTDKAVNPTSVMGATKRIGEMIVQSLAKTSNVQCSAVRFGNVLGSRGSVIPTMRRQIARGGPVTVTDARMTRYFMTIPEAVQLILQAGAIGGSGEIFLLDMGQPVRILDLARDLIRLSGYRPEIDIRIALTGARPGEKIVEELLYDAENAQQTAHEKIFVTTRNGIDPEMVRRDVEWLICLAREGECPEALRPEILRVARNGSPHIAVAGFALSHGSTGPALNGASANGTGVQGASIPVNGANRKGAGPEEPASGAPTQ